MSKRTKLDTVGLQWPSKRVEALGERKFRDIVGILPRPGHLRDKAQISGDCPGHSGTVGNYVYVPNVLCCNLLQVCVGGSLLRSSFSVISCSDMALGRSCLLAITSKQQSLSSSSHRNRLSSSLHSSILSRSLLSTTKMSTSVFW